MRRWERSLLRMGFATVAMPLVLTAAASSVAAQSAGAGRIVGRVLDVETGQGVVGVLVEVRGAALGALSGIGGAYMLRDVPAGTVTLQVSSLGFATKIVTGVSVPAGRAVEQNITLQPAALELATIEVSAGAERGSVSRALDQQRTAFAIVNAVTAEQIARSPDGDAAAAMQRVSGVTVQDGKYVLVRGLGERYTVTSLNGARIPSPDPERKVVPLDLFPSGLLQTITTAKTFTPDQPGDFSGGQVDIQTREFTAQNSVGYSVSLGYNDRVTGQILPFAPTIGTEWLGFAGGGRQLPAAVRDAGAFTEPPSHAEVNRMVRSFRNAWWPRRATATPNASLGFTAAGSDALFRRPIAYLVSGTYAHASEARAGEVRAQAIAGRGGEAIEADRFEGSTGRTSVLWGGLLNLSTLLGEKTRLLVNATYNRGADNEARTELGSSENHGGLPLRIDRLRFVGRSVGSVQFKGEHELGRQQRVDWNLTASAVRRNEPDRSEVVYTIQTDPSTGQPLPPAWFSASNEGAVRTFGDLTEDNVEVATSYRLGFGRPARAGAIRLGGAFRATRRDADNRAYSISTGVLTQRERSLVPEQIFDGRFAGPDDTIFRITPLSQGGSYRAREMLAAGYGMLEIAVSDAVRLVGGARIERAETELVAQPTIGQPLTSRPDYTDILPALSVTIRLRPGQNLRLSGSQTLARPEYRELAGIQYREVLGGDNVIGNPDLRRTLIRNVDARWEWYPGPAEVVSAGVFAKQFRDPIERVYLATSGTRVITFVNAEAARNYGLELELRKRLGSVAAILDPFLLFANATLMKSDIRIGSSPGRTSSERAMVGQAPWVLNAGLTWTGESRTSATLLYNVVGERIHSAAEVPLTDIVERPRHMLDLSLRFALGGGLAARLDARNLLDAPYELVQGEVTRERYQAGRVVSVGVSWNR